ncbi:(2Fe-2S)-binding protein [Oceanirhabdus sp. W0125-5]|uniref:(2Fe-2S)-binding protein n=1 Tax=Oceanirhabdus sp. W0125-5 TaxID=2999116 RepID=UPI0022F2B88B|nr:(2Fe-2S)-binding protein [Oceanirhabdus sp. W0125-5]WBW95558.1 (2Fe-2S)-binding protein [Oceanirhabdus sp. W0125-5]
MDENSIIICRCSDITLKEIKELLNEGYLTVEEIKRISRAGMGPCQGKTCGGLIQREISKFTNEKMENVKVSNTRPPAKAIKLEDIANGVENHEENC